MRSIVIHRHRFYEAVQAYEDAGGRGLPSYVLSDGFSLPEPGGVTLVLRDARGKMAQATHHADADHWQIDFDIDVANDEAGDG